MRRLRDAKNEAIKAIIVLDVRGRVTAILANKSWGIGDRIFSRVLP